MFCSLQSRILHQLREMELSFWNAQMSSGMKILVAWKSCEKSL